MGKNSTLNDLSEFLRQNPNEVEVGKPKSREEFVKKEPNALVEVPKIKEEQKKYHHLEHISLAEIAEYLHNKAKEEERSYVELWLKLLEEGAKIDPLLKNTTAFKTFRTINKTSFNVVFEGLSQFIKNKR